MNQISGVLLLFLLIYLPKYNLYSQEERIYSLLNNFLSNSKIDTTILTKLKKDTSFIYTKHDGDSTIELDISVLTLKKVSKKESADTLSILFSSLSYKMPNQLLVFNFRFNKNKKKEAIDKFNLLDQTLSKLSTEKYHYGKLKKRFGNYKIEDKKHEIKYLLPKTKQHGASVSLYLYRGTTRLREYIVCIAFMSEY